MNNKMKQNIILIMTDEQRARPIYEYTDEINEIYQKEMKGYNFLKKNSIEFVNHYTQATACTPSRASIFTGKPMFEHKINKTTGFDKHDDDPKCTWLDNKNIKTFIDNSIKHIPD